jgi:hypothetical protein
VRESEAARDLRAEPPDQPRHRAAGKAKAMNAKAASGRKPEKWIAAAAGTSVSTAQKEILLDACDRSMRQAAG